MVRHGGSATEHVGGEKASGSGGRVGRESAAAIRASRMGRRSAGEWKAQSHRRPCVEKRRGRVMVPIQLVWMEPEISGQRRPRHSTGRPHPARPDGESDSIDLRAPYSDLLHPRDEHVGAERASGSGGRVGRESAAAIRTSRMGSGNHHAPSGKYARIPPHRSTILVRNAAADAPIRMHRDRACRSGAHH